MNFPRTDRDRIAQTGRPLTTTEKNRAYQQEQLRLQAEYMQKLNVALQLDENSPYLLDVVRRTGFTLERVYLAALRSGHDAPTFHAILKSNPFWLFNFVDPLDASDPRKREGGRSYTHDDIPNLQAEVERLASLVLDSASQTEQIGAYNLYQFYSALLDLLETMDEVPEATLQDAVSTRLAGDQ